MVDESKLEKWREILTAWMMHGWNPSNVDGQLDAFRNGGISKNGNSRKSIPQSKPLADWQIDPTKTHDEYLRLNRKFLTPDQIEEAIVKGIHTR